MPDRAHAQNAKARASQQKAKGKLSAAQKAAIDAKANRVLGGSAANKAKKNAAKRAAQRGRGVKR